MTWLTLHPHIPQLWSLVLGHLAWKILFWIPHAALPLNCCLLPSTMESRILQSCRTCLLKSHSPFPLVVMINIFLFVLECAPVLALDMNLPLLIYLLLPLHKTLSPFQKTRKKPIVKSTVHGPVNPWLYLPYLPIPNSLPALLSLLPFFSVAACDAA